MRDRSDSLESAGAPRRAALSFMRDMKEAMGCEDCGITDHRVLDFDHVYGFKTANLSAMAQHGASEEALLEEMSKCQVRCSNCHRIRHYEEDRTNDPIMDFNRRLLEARRMRLWTLTDAPEKCRQ